jgi:cysteine-rich repeat protein
MLIRVLSLVATCAFVLAVACSDDTTNPPPQDKGITDIGVKPEGTTPPKEGGPTDGPITDGPAAVDCASKTDGFECGTGMICLAKACVASMCGDQYVDTKAGEECDDNNADPADGCNACKFNCKADADCDDKEVCTGTESCDTATHKCKAGTLAADGTVCTLAAGGNGKCAAGTCVTGSCGDGVTAAPEECDDANKVDGDGCETTCKFTCKADADCDDGNKCNGAEKCDTATHKCAAGTALSCNDNQTCTTDACDPAQGCVHTFIDADKDGKSCADDCVDTDATVYVGAPECGDGKDNDCDKQVDELPNAPVKCYLDKDADSYAVDATGMVTNANCKCPTGYTLRDPTVAGNKDCQGSNGSVFPGQAGWFSTGYCPSLFCLPTSKKSFDYNCDGKETQRYQVVAPPACKKLSLLGKTVCLGDGWVGTVPACGVSGSYRNCTYNPILGICMSSIGKTMPQECH